ncbi:hypothetical protein KSF_009910 [Reticulibacter mediterranei]|uniref:Uncharacterized protein n=1 Tax=Reticulibacter mediterranei TaxID=2778369 RepID=A0A8J3IEA1_9CHLR|nr:hypothetical protein [Reticulibacter mediterranei]GHO90943.1 hypothetical protein KSF_009910 [Reticulibacter mediterranei]
MHPLSSPYPFTPPLSLINTEKARKRFGERAVDLHIEMAHIGGSQRFGDLLPYVLSAANFSTPDSRVNPGGKQVEKQRQRGKWLEQTIRQVT